MGKSIERDGLFGKYTEHYDDTGKKVGESRERDGLFGRYTEHTDASGKKIGESRERDGIFGSYTEHTDESSTKVGESRDKDGLFGAYTEHTDRSGTKVGESRERDGIFGSYTEHEGTPPFWKASPIQKNERTSGTDSSSFTSATGKASGAEPVGKEDFDFVSVITGLVSNRHRATAKTPAQANSSEATEGRSTLGTVLRILLVLGIIFAISAAWESQSEEEKRSIRRFILIVAAVVVTLVLVLALT